MVIFFTNYFTSQVKINEIAVTLKSLFPKGKKKLK